MKHRTQPEPTPRPPVDRAKVHELVAGLHAAVCRGESIHATAPIYSLDDLCGGSCMVGYYVAGMLGHPDGPPSVDTMTDHIMKCAARWAEDAAWGRSHP